MASAPPSERFFASQDDGLGWQFLAQHAGLEYQPGMWSICREVRGKIMGVAGYTDLHREWCALHLAGLGPHWLSREFLYKIFDVPFQQWGMGHLVAAIPRDNPRSLRLGFRLGFTEFDIVPGTRQDRDLVFMRLSRENCRWLKLPRR